MLELDWHLFIWQYVNLTHLYCNLYSILICKQSQEKLFSSSYPSGKTGSSLKKDRMRAQEKQDEAWEKQLTSRRLFFLGLILPFPSPLPVFPEPLPVFHRGLSYEKVFPSFVYLLGKKITSVGKIEGKGKMGPAQDKKFTTISQSLTCNRRRILLLIFS